MQLLFALYDPGAAARNGSHWTWHSSSLPMSLLDRVFYEANEQRPEAPSALTTENVWGGVARIDDAYVAVYRFADGGRDRLGRPGRWVLVVAFVRISDAIGKDLLPLLNLPEFERIVRGAPHECPVVAPAMLEIELTHWPVIEQTRYFKGLSERRGDLYLAHAAEAGQRMAMATANQWWRCTVRIHDSEQCVQFEELSQAAPRIDEPLPTTCPTSAAPRPEGPPHSKPGKTHIEWLTFAFAKVKAIAQARSILLAFLLGFAVGFIVACFLITGSKGREELSTRVANELFLRIKPEHDLLFTQELCERVAELLGIPRDSLPQAEDKSLELDLLLERHADDSTEWSLLDLK
ncbi:MAG TPA: hypothetical protein PKC18_00675 [Lacipirellulaceae bacterium]|nr:hypothetical protein [Lacipirellulaceae bacterium]HMP07271.1 hypothetical protein [Lacipirellulaceae bacterium]